MRGFIQKGLGIFIVLTVLVSFFPAQSVQAETVIGVDTTWSGTVALDRDVVVQSGATLTVDPGTTVTVACSDAGHYVGGEDPDRVEIIILSGGAMNADGATFTQASSGPQPCWFGITYKAGSSGMMDGNTVQFAARGIKIQADVDLTNNEIQYIQGESADAASGDGHQGYGIVISADGLSPLIQGNEIYDVSGGDGYPGAAGADGSSPGASGSMGGYGGDGGSAMGIYVDRGSPIIEDNEIHTIQSGECAVGGNGGNGVAGANGADGSAAGEAGSAGGNGGDGGAGGTSNGSYGIAMSSEADQTIIRGNHIYNVWGVRRLWR